MQQTFVLLVPQTAERRAAEDIPGHRHHNVCCGPSPLPLPCSSSCLSKKKSRLGVKNSPTRTSGRSLVKTATKRGSWKLSFTSSSEQDFGVKKEEGGGEADRQVSNMLLG